MNISRIAAAALVSLSLMPLAALAETPNSQGPATARVEGAKAESGHSGKAVHHKRMMRSHRQSAEHRAAQQPAQR